MSEQHRRNRPGRLIRYWQHCPGLIGPMYRLRRGDRARDSAPRNAHAPWGRGWALDDDLDLVQAVIRGDVSAARTFVDRVGPVAMGIFRNHFRLDHSTAEDLFQQVFVRLAENGFRRLRTYQGESRLETWFTVVCRHAAVDHLRANRSRAQPAEVIDGDEPENPLEELPGDCDTRDEASAEELRARMNEALSHLQDDHRAVLEFFYRDNLEYAEIAARTGDTVNHVGVKLTRARAKLRGIIAEKFPDLSLYLDDE